MVVPQSIRRPEPFGHTRVSVKGQTVIPREIRRLFNIGSGSRLRWEVRGHVIVVSLVSPDPLGASVGALAGVGLSLPDWVKNRHRVKE